MTHKREAGIVVVGGGTGGCYLAWRLAQAGLRVLVLEKQRPADGGQAIDVRAMQGGAPLEVRGICGKPGRPGSLGARGEAPVGRRQRCSDWMI